MTTIKQVVNALEQLAPPTFQENYDNAGLLVGDSLAEVTGVLVSLDVTEDVVDEAVRKKCNLVVSHHPIIFKGLKQLTGANYVERTVIKAIRSNVALFASHTNLDSVIPNGVNEKIAQILGLNDIRILTPKEQTLLKLSFYVPIEATENVTQALFAAGAGNIGNYSQCSFSMRGTGAFLPLEKARPSIGEIGLREEVLENRVEVLVPKHLSAQILRALRKAHPYEEVAYYLTALENGNQQVGMGALGNLQAPISEDDFLGMLSERLHLKVIRHTALTGHEVKKIAICGGSGSFLLRDAIASGAQAFVTSDFKYHEFFDADKNILICDVGHYESEVCTIELLAYHLTKKFSNFAVHLTGINTNPVFYYQKSHGKHNI